MRGLAHTRLESCAAAQEVQQRPSPGSSSSTCSSQAAAHSAGASQGSLQRKGLGLLPGGSFSPLVAAAAQGGSCDRQADERIRASHAGMLDAEEPGMDVGVSTGSVLAPRKALLRGILKPREVPDDAGAAAAAGGGAQQPSMRSRRGVKGLLAKLAAGCVSQPAAQA